MGGEGAEDMDFSYAQVWPWASDPAKMAQANDWLNEQESDDAAHKSRRWLNELPTPGQLRYLPPEARADFGLTRYQASALLTFRFNKHAIQRVVHAANQSYLEAA